MIFHILGGGSLGQLWASRLALAGFDCRLILRDPPALTEWNSAGAQITLRQPDRCDTVAVPGQLATQPEPIDNLIVATKAYAVVDALTGLAARMKPNSTALLLQNGLGSQQAAHALLSGQRVLYASVTDGAWRDGTNTVVWAGKGQTRLGDPDHGDHPIWLAPLRASGIACSWENDILPVLWEKLAINCSINPLTAIHDCRNGAIPQRAGPRLALVVAELQTLLVQAQMPHIAARLPETVDEVICRTADNSSSMRQDVKAGRRTEIEFILGYACRAATASGCNVPQLQALYAELRALLASRGLPVD